MCAFVLRRSYKVSYVSIYKCVDIVDMFIVDIVDVFIVEGRVAAF